MYSKLIQTATQNVSDILHHSIKFDPNFNKALVIFDTQNELTNILAATYRSALPTARFIDFATLTKEQIIATFDEYSPADLVVMIQTSSFRLDDFRIRIHLFKLKVKVIEHLHLYRNPPATWASYIDSLGYDQSYYQTMGVFLKDTLSSTNNLIIRSQNGNLLSELVVKNGLEIPKLNTGDYAGMDNIGGTFPIGEVFTEAKILESMNGSFWVYAFADANFEMIIADPFRVDVVDGLVVGYAADSPLQFIEVFEKVRSIERPIIREIGFGLNRAMSRQNPLGDITAFERIVGVHLSLGEKHSVYKKSGITAHKARFHVDLFLKTSQVIADDKVIFEDGQYMV